MKALSPDLAAHLASGATTLCWCWRVVRRDGVVLGFTDHDRALTFDGTTYEAASGFTASDWYLLRLCVDRRLTKMLEKDDGRLVIDTQRLGYPTIVLIADHWTDWKPLAGADSYRVEVFDENFNRVAESPQLKTTTWTIRQPLRRGRVYGWQVTATKDGAEIKSPVRPAPDARFKVIDAESSNAIAAAHKQGGSHLVLGILYAEAGMLPEAEKEFAALLHANPDSSVVRSLLQKVRSLH